MKYKQQLQALQLTCAPRPVLMHNASFSLDQLLSKYRSFVTAVSFSMADQTKLLLELNQYIQQIITEKAECDQLLLVALQLKTNLQELRNGQVH